MRTTRLSQLAPVLVASTLLVSQMAGLAASNEPEAISNQGLPIAAPESSSLARKVWGTIDPRRLKSASKKKSTQETAKAKDSTTTEATTASTPQATPPAQEVAAQPATPEPVAPVASVAESTASSEQPVTTPAPEAKETPAPEALKQETPKAAAPEETKTQTTATTENATEDPNSSAPKFSVASNISTLPSTSVLNQIAAGQPVVVDSDEDEAVEETLQYEEMPTDEGATVAKAGARFPIVISSQLTSKTAKENDLIRGHLKYDLKIGDRLVAAKGSVVNGHLNYVLPARTILHSLVSKERWYRNSGTLGLAFDEIVNEKNEHIPLKAQPARAARIVKNKAEGRELGVNMYGQVTGPWAQQLRYKAVRIGLNAAMAPVGAMSFGAMPVALGVLGAVNPNFAFSKPVGLNVRHRRLKGFAWGFLSGIPGSWLIEDTTVKGQEAVIKPGDEFYAELVEEFTGKPASDAELMPGAQAKVKGQVLTKAKKKKEKTTTPPTGKKSASSSETK